jgi:hypothetical protein
MPGVDRAASAAIDIVATGNALPPESNYAFWESSSPNARDRGKNETNRNRSAYAMACLLG